MALPDISIDDSIVKACPSACLGCIAYKVAVSPNSADLWEYYEHDVAGPLRAKLESVALADMPQIGESRAAYKAFGIDPGRYRISSEALYRRVRQGKPLYTINSLVDANNLVSLETGFSLGSYDLACVGPDIVFRLGRQGESYAGIGKANLPLENMPLLADAGGPFGSPTSDSTRGMIGPETKEGLTVLYSFAGSGALEGALEQAQRQLVRFAGITAPEAFLISA